MSQTKLWHENRHHNVHLVSIVHICVCHNVVVTLGVDVELVVIVVVVVEVVVDVGHDGEDVEGGGEESHLSNAHSGRICCCGTPEQDLKKSRYAADTIHIWYVGGM